jgi:site-specific DNA-methyltransferase (adenine-specific)
MKPDPSQAGSARPADSTRVKLYRGDCLKVLATKVLSGCEAVVTDPPWGIDADTNYTRFTPSAKTLSAWPHRDHGPGIRGDDSPFDPSPWLAFPHVAFWGAHCFAGRLPVGQWLVWIKKRDAQFGSFLSDAELCWTNKRPARRRAPGIYCFRHIWSGWDRQSETGKTLHPTQKPVAVMRWCIQRLRLRPGSTIVDPYMGSGAVGIAAVQLGFNFIGIEIDPQHFAIAKARIKAAQSEDSRNELIYA